MDAELPHSSGHSNDDGDDEGEDEWGEDFWSQTRFSAPPYCAVK